MELSLDWRGFVRVFEPHRRGALRLDVEPSNQIFVVAEDGIVFSAYSEDEDFATWIGSTLDEFKSHFTGRTVLVFERKDVEKNFRECLGAPHEMKQVEILREKQKIAREFFPEKHFLLSALPTWWGRVFPSHYGIFFRLTGKAGVTNRDFLVLIKGGEVEAFFEPDISSMGADRRQETESVVKFLSEKYNVLIQGLSVSTEEWEEWCKVSNPWAQIAGAIRRERAKLVPFRWGVLGLIATRAYFRV